MDLGRRKLLELGIAAGSASMAGCLSPITEFESGNSTDTDGQSDDDVGGLLVSKAGPGPLADAGDVHSDWIHVVGRGDAYDVTFDARLCHDRGEVGTVNLADDGAGIHTLALGTEQSTETRTPPTTPGTEDGCDFGTRITGSGRVPVDFKKLRVTARSRAVQTVPNEGTMPLMRPLPAPVEL
jgi:hypothetical protein